MQDLLPRCSGCGISGILFAFAWPGDVAKKKPAAMSAAQAHCQHFLMDTAPSRAAMRLVYCAIRRYGRRPKTARKRRSEAEHRRGVEFLITNGAGLLWAVREIIRRIR